MEGLCLAEFAAYYFKEHKTNCTTNDAQPEILAHYATELHVPLSTNTDLTSQLPPRIKLVNSNEVMKRRKIKAVVRYITPNKIKEHENYFHHLLMLIIHGGMKILWLAVNKHASKFYEPEVHISF